MPRKRETESYVSVLTKWVEKNKEGKNRRKDMNLLAFLAVQDDVSAALKVGYSVKTIWEHLHETKRITYSYEAFNRRVNKQIKKRNNEAANKSPEVKSSLERGFSFSVNPEKEELI